MALEFKLDRPDGRTVVATVQGPLTLGTNLKIMDTQLQQLVSEGATRFVLDLAECPYTDSSGLGTLVHLAGLLQANGGALRLCSVPERILAMLQMTHTASLLPCDPDVAASLAAFG